MYYMLGFCQLPLLCTALYSGGITLYCTILYSGVPHCNVLQQCVWGYCIVLYCTVLVLVLYLVSSPYFVLHLYSFHRYEGPGTKARSYCSLLHSYSSPATTALTTTMYSSNTSWLNSLRDQNGRPKHVSPAMLTSMGMSNITYHNQRIDKRFEFEKHKPLEYYMQVGVVHVGGHVGGCTICRCAVLHEVG